MYVLYSFNQYVYTHTYTVELQNDWLLNGGFPRMPVAEIVGLMFGKVPVKRDTWNVLDNPHVGVPEPERQFIASLC